MVISATNAKLSNTDSTEITARITWDANHCNYGGTARKPRLSSDINYKTAARHDPDVDSYLTSPR